MQLSKEKLIVKLRPTYYNERSPMSIKENVTKLIANGYHLIPIRPNEKRPAISNWQNARLSADEILKHTAKGCGIGILTGVGDHPVCGVDIDSMDEDIINSFTMKFGTNVMRLGNPPKALMLFATLRSQSKITSHKFLDAEGGVHQLEILGKGQQFVAYGVHPTTGKKYEWINSSPVDSKIDHLPILDLDKTKDMLDIFEALCLERGYKAQGAPLKVFTKDAMVDVDDDPFTNLKQTVGLTWDECTAILAPLDVNDYDMWLKVGMALNHEYGYTDDWAEALGMWDQWSQKGATYRGYGDLLQRWHGFGKGSGEPVTMRSLQYHKAEIETAEMRAERVAIGGAIKAQVEACTDVYTLMDQTAAAVGAMTGGDTELKRSAENAIRKRYKALSGDPVPVVDVRTAIAKGESSGAGGGGSGAVTKMSRPDWCNGWVHIGEQNLFYNIHNGVKLRVEAFRLAYADKGGDAGRWAVEEGYIPRVDRRAYLPQAGALYTLDDVKYVNTYLNNGILSLEGDRGENYERDSAIFKKHIEWMIGGGQWTRECQLFVNFLRHTIEHPGKRIPWAILLQGGEGDGKSEPIRKLMTRLVGRTNVAVIAAQTIEGSNFNSWAEGHVFGVIEEIKMHGHNRFDILNSLKAVITNDMIEIHRKGESPYPVPNTGNYYITTNYKDALPIGGGDRRYMILFSRFPEEMRKDSRYFDRMFAAIMDNESCRAIGQWLLSVDYHKDFKPRGRAPHTEDKIQAIDLASDVLKHEIEDILESSDSPLFGKNYVFAGPLIEYLSYENNGSGKVSTQLIARYLEELGYVFVGRARIKGKRPSAYLRKSIAEELTGGAKIDKCVELYDIQQLIT